MGAQSNAGSPPRSRNAITVSVANPQKIKQSIESEKGHVVVVNFWATWCSPCVAEFPALIKLYNDHRAAGLELITVSADQRGDISAKVLPFLKSHKAYSTNFLMHAKDPEDAINAFDRSWQGDLPRTFIYDKKGHLAKTLAGEQTFAELEAAVRPFLN
jgi:thiol-disulfide isomerase/thioredoxin